MKVLVSGGAGFIGSHTVDMLLEKGYEVRILDGLEPPVHPHRARPGYVPREVEFHLGDVRKRADVAKALRGVDAVIHLAAYQDYLNDFSKFAHVNDLGTALLYEVMVKERLPIRKVVLGSSQAVYGEGKYECVQHGAQYPLPRPLEQLMRREWEIKCPHCGLDMRPLPIQESTVNPHNQYAVSKYCQELYALTLGRRYDIPTTALRYSIVQGPRQSFYNAYSGILRIFTTRLLNGLPPIVYEDGQQVRDYVYVKDVARANLLALESDAANFEALSVGNSRTTTVQEYAHMLIKLLNKDMAPEVLGQFRFGDTRHIRVDISKIQKLGWHPVVPLEQFAQEYIDWVREQPGVTDYSAQAAQLMKERGVLRTAAARSTTK